MPACCSCCRLVLLRAHVLDALNIGVVGIDGAETVEIGPRERVIAAELCRARKTGQSVDVVGVGQQHLLPRLRSHVEPAAHLKGVCFVEQRLRGGLSRLRVKIERHRRKNACSQQNRRPQWPN